MFDSCGLENSYFLILSSPQALITQARTKQAATMSEVEWRGRTVPVKIDKARIFLLGLADNEAAIAQVIILFSPKNKLSCTQCEAL